MSLIRTIDETEYPESDGKPMGETDLHIDWMIRLRDILRLRYRDERVYVASNLLLYYREGDPSQFVVPDLFVVKDCDPGRRRTFKAWEEGKTPNVVIEVTSRSSRQDDEVTKFQIYARLGVQEYFLYDPTADYLDPPLQGFRLKRRKYARIDPEATGTFSCQQLNVTLRLEERDLVLSDGSSGQRLLTAGEAAEAIRQAETAARQVAEAARAAAEQRVASLETELQRLRAELSRRPRDA